MYAGRLNKRINIEREIRSSDGAGGSNSTWSQIKSIFAEIKPVSGREVVNSQRLQAQLTHKIIVRFTTDIRPSDRIEYNGRFFNIRAIINVEEQNKWLEIMADEGVAQ